MRLPKLRGGSFSSKITFAVIHLSDLAVLAEQGHTEITVQTLLDAGYIRGKKPRVKLLSGGEITTAVTLSVHAASGAAKKSLENAGGTLTLVV
jgi:large subunit ribosomal protein L15